MASALSAGSGATAQAMVEQARVEEAAAELKLGRLHTEASITAKPFFEKKGFRVISAQTVHVRGQDLVNYRMEKLRA